MASILTRANISEAISAIGTYESTCDGIFESFKGTMTTLTGSNWNGDGADGCNEFFNSKVTDALTTSLKDVTKTLKDILENIGDTLLDQLDPELGNVNRNPG